MKDLELEMSTFRFLFCPSPSLTSQSKILKLKKNYIELAFSIFPLGMERTKTRNHEVLLKLADLSCVWESKLSHFSEEGRKESIVLFTIPRLHTLSHFISGHFFAIEQSKKGWKIMRKLGVKTSRDLETDLNALNYNSK